MRRFRPLIAVAACITLFALPAAARTPAQAADELLAADRAFSAASMQTDAVSGLSAMFADDVVMPLPGAIFGHGKAEAVAALRTNPLRLRTQLHQKVMAAARKTPAM